MSIGNALISKLENLAQLQLSDGEHESIGKDLNAILSMIEHMNQLDTTDIAPLVYLHENENRMRKDTISGQTARNIAMINCPEHTNVFIKVPKIINKENAAG
jgi:aspartyl-tRNA(Asn)/glutamyl-tRNA(Gln) amidotransferase subunit C